MSEKLDHLVTVKEKSVFNAVADEISAKNRGWLTGRVNEEAEQLLSDRIAESGSLAAIPGKIVLSQLSRWFMDTYGVGLSHSGIAAEITANEMDAEVRRVLEAIQNGVAFANDN